MKEREKKREKERVREEERERDSNRAQKLDFTRMVVYVQ